MIVKKGNSHRHNYQLIELSRIFGVRKEYEGTTGDRAILTRKCIAPLTNEEECPARHAFEYGKYKDMLELYNLLTKEVEHAKVR